MQLFILSPVCQTHRHCPTCRDREGGRQWRESLAVSYALPADGPDFACPEGHPWGFEGFEFPRQQPAPRRQLTPAEIQARLDAEGYDPRGPDGPFGGCCGAPATAET